MNEFHQTIKPVQRTQGRTPPQNIEMEQSVLGAILLDNNVLSKALEVLAGAEDFYKPAHRKIYDAMIDLYERNEPTDLLTLTENLRKSGLLNEIGGTDYLADLTDIVPTAANIRVHAKVVREKAILRKLITVAGEVGSLAFEDSEDIETLLDRVERMVLEISQERARKSFLSMKTVINAGMETVARLYDNKSLITGVTTGYKDLDEKTAGLQPSDLIIVAGRPSMGKTALAMNIVQNAASDNDEAVVAVFSLEMNAEQLALRMLCSEAKVSGNKMRTGFLAQSDWPKLSAAAGRLHAASIFIDDTASQTALDIRAKARRLKNEQGRLDLIVVDYLQLMSARGRVESRHLEVSEITRSLKQLAKELHVPVIAISQLSRKVEDREGKRPQLADLRESGSIEQDADLVIFVYREEFYDRDKPEAQGKAEIIIGKQRNGPTGVVKLAFLKDFTRFEDLAAADPAGYVEFEEQF